MKLPGPLYGSVTPFYSVDEQGVPTVWTSFSANVAEYTTTVPSPYSSSSRMVTELVCPSRESVMPIESESNCNSYLLQPKVMTVNRGLQRPFGYPNRDSPTESLNFSDIQNPATAPVMFDLDADIWRELGNSSPSGVPEHPAHGNTRNYLYFDGHVEAVSVSEN